MNYKLLGSLTMCLLTVGAVFAINSEPTTKNSFSLPENAQALLHAPNVFDLGKRIDPDSGLEAQGYAIMHYKQAKDYHAKPANPGNGGGGNGGGGSTCYGFIANGAKWKTMEPRVVNGANTEGIAPSEFFSIVDGAINKWESAANNTNVFGNGTLTTELLDAGEGLNSVNEVVFGSIEDAGVIGVTIVRGYFGGSPKNRQLIERDQIYDQDDFDWATDGNPNDMDVDNIVTHEMGHSFGLGDLYDANCASETMYGYANEGEISKRTLEAGDIVGINKYY